MLSDKDITMLAPRKQAFTLIELLVVISIIALLIGILLPALGAARRTGQAAKSLSNVRQWGIGTIAFTHENDGMIPWDGEDNPTGGGAQMTNGFGRDYWWGNAVTPFLGQDAYAKLVADRLAAGREIPLPPEDSIFIDPSAVKPANGPYPTPTSTPRYFFCYVPNSKLDTDGKVRDSDGNKRANERLIKAASSTVLMLEMKTVRDEVAPNNPFYSKDGDRAKADWQRFTGRHDKGGHILFADGHASRVKNEYAVKADATDFVSGTAGGFNKPDLIWNPTGIAD